MPRLNAFIHCVVKSRLLGPDQIDAVRSSLPDLPGDDAVPFARALVDRGLLTKYQANKLLNGRTWGFFLGDYRIMKRLGEGGMGKVYLARRERDNLRVAIKVLPPKKALEDEQALKRFYREMELSRRVRHPNLTRTLEVGSVGDAHYMVMEYVPGDSLYNLVKGIHGGSGPLRFDEAARYFIRALAGLHAAHQAGLVHRDVKPSNLMVTPEGDAKLLDLGLAKSMHEESALTHPNAVVGTLDYASPEQLADASKADGRSDLYSIGCTIYFALSGRPPFEGGDIVSKIFRHRMEDPDPLEKICPDVPAAFAAIIWKAMAKQPEDRQQTASELQADLARWADPERPRPAGRPPSGSAPRFRPPPPELDDEDIRLDDNPSQFSALGALRDLGGAEISAPLSRPPILPRAAVIIQDDDSGEVPLSDSEIGLDAEFHPEPEFDSEPHSRYPPLPSSHGSPDDGDRLVRIAFSVLAVLVVLAMLALMISNN
ncbi:serine/threonine-protein kinase [Tautonia plasticadhaerens]|uniref:non-specific serine/threonine protein kinase n=1 Tax=Tautonia plasticadhaerens TaxID=2527974 RepID=A0A518H8L6_9BACT|nr:serine/threonine-protein kinase [Tautonia plasticadhaerens]QDV37197.1 Serine/threonine-protein kinase PrkC [Tautonia plasticadhaerens]